MSSSTHEDFFRLLHAGTGHEVQHQHFQKNQAAQHLVREGIRKYEGQIASGAI